MRANGQLVWTVILAGLLGGCEILSPMTYEPSIAYDMAADAGRPFSDRRPAALMLDGLELSKLRGLLMMRIPHGWYTTATNDTLILVAVGDEGTAGYFEGLYAQVPDTREDEGSMTVLLHTAAAQIRNRMGSHALEIAGDRDVFEEERVRAALRLGGTERAQVQALLLARVPGKGEFAMANDLAVLGEIGDEAAAVRLEADDGYAETGEMKARLRGAVERIRARMAGGRG